MKTQWTIVSEPRALALYGMLLFSLMILGASRADAAVVRGRLVHQGQAASGIAVTVYSPSAKRTVPVRTDSSGIYYIPNVAPGNYTLEVWTSTGGGAQPRTQAIKVNDPYTDVATIVLP
ncbi:MAG: carboxypeptidase-like regulatory domain-containing protein [Terriglobales bacterium]